MLLRALFAFSFGLVLFCLPGRAQAAPRSLASALARLPATIEIIGTTNIQKVRSTETFAKLFTKAIDNDKEASTSLARLRSVRKIDPVKQVEDATFAFGEPNGEVLFVALTGVSEASAISCIVKMLEAKESGAKSEKVDTKGDANIYKISSSSGDPRLVAYIPGDVLVIGPKTKEKLVGAISGAGAIQKSKVGSRLSKLNANAALSFAFAREEKISGKKVKGGHATLTAEGGNADLSGSVEFATAAEAREAGSMVDSMKRFVSGLQITMSTNGATLNIRAQIPEKELIKVLEARL